MDNKSLNNKLELLLENEVAEIKKDKIGNKKGEHSVIYINGIQYIYNKENPTKKLEKAIETAYKKEEKKTTIKEKKTRKIGKLPDTDFVKLLFNRKDNNIYIYKEL